MRNRGQFVLLLTLPPLLLGVVACTPTRSGNGGHDGDSVTDDDVVDDDDAGPSAAIPSVDPAQGASDVFGQRVSLP